MHLFLFSRISVCWSLILGQSLGCPGPEVLILEVRYDSGLISSSRAGLVSVILVLFIFREILTSTMLHQRGNLSTCPPDGPPPH